MAKADPTMKATPAAKATPPVDAAPAERAPGQCVVDDGTMHVGRAVNGLVCSYHAVNYRSDGTRRSP